MHYSRYLSSSGAGYSWDERSGSYRTQLGGRNKRFPGIARGDHVAIATAFEAYRAEVFRQAGPPEPLSEDVCLAFVEATPARR